MTSSRGSYTGVGGGARKALLVLRETKAEGLGLLKKNVVSLRLSYLSSDKSDRGGLRLSRNRPAGAGILPTWCF